MAKVILKKNKEKGLDFSDTKSYYKAIGIKSEWC